MNYKNLFQQYTSWSTISNAGSLFGTRVVNSGLGFFFWMVVARLFPPEEVGLGSAVISAVVMLSTLGTFGVGTYLIGELPKSKNPQGGSILIALSLVGLISGIIGLFFVFVISYFSVSFGGFLSTERNIFLFVLGVILMSISFVIDNSAVGLLRGNIQFWRNLIAAGIRLVLIIILGLFYFPKNALSIYSTVLVGLAISLPFIFYVFRNNLTLKRVKERFSWTLIRKMIGSSFWHHLINLSLQTPLLFIPLVVVSLLSAEANAYYYQAWMIAGFVSFISISLSTSIFAVVSENPDSFSREVNSGMKLSLGLGVLGVAFLVLVGPLIFEFYGQDYVRNAIVPLRLLAVSALPFTIKPFYVTVFRLADRERDAAIVLTLSSLGEIAAASIGAIYWGLEGLCFSWLVCLIFEACFFYPFMRKHVISLKPLHS